MDCTREGCENVSWTPECNTNAEVKSCVKIDKSFLKHKRKNMYTQDRIILSQKLRYNTEQVGIYIYIFSTIKCTVERQSAANQVGGSFWLRNPVQR